MKETIEEATATISQLKKIAVANSEATLSDLIAGSFMGGMSQSKRLEIHDNIIAALKDIGVDEADLNFVEREWKKGISVIYMRAISSAVEGRKNHNFINKDVTEAQKQASQELDILSDFDNWVSPTPDQVRKVIEKYSVESELVLFWLGEYEHFTLTNEIKNKDKFLHA